MAEKSATSIVTGEIRISYEHLWEKHSMKPDQKAKYSAAILIKKSDKSTKAKIDAAVKAACELGKTNLKEWKGKIPVGDKLKLPLRDGDTEKEDESPDYAGCYWLNAKNDSQPGMIDASGNRITDKAEIYSGVHGHANLNFYPYSNNGSHGIAVSFENFLKTRDGDPLAGGVAPEEAFADLLKDGAGGSVENDDDDL